MSSYKSIEPYSYLINLLGYGYNNPTSIDEALDKCFMPGKQILERLLAKKSHTADELRIIEENNQPMTEEEKRDFEAQISEEDKLDFEIYELSDQIISGFNNNLDKKSEVELQTMLLQHKQYPYTRLTQLNVISWNKWKIEQISKKIASK